MIKEGDTIRIEELSSKYPKSWILKLSTNGELSTHLGKIFHKECIGRRFGDTLILKKGQVVILKPLSRDFLHHFKLKTQIMYEDDCAIACNIAGLGPGMRVGEAGSGSGALTLFLAHSIQPSGHVYSYDINQKHLENAKKNIDQTSLSNYITFNLKDVREPLDIRDLDAFFLDFATPHEAIDNVTETLKGGGHLICFVPNWGQVEDIVNQILINPFLYHRETFEITRRNFIVNPNKRIMRPIFRDQVYSGILIHAIKILPNHEVLYNDSYPKESL